MVFVDPARERGEGKDEVQHTVDSHDLRGERGNGEKEGKGGERRENGVMSMSKTGVIN